MSFQQPIYQTIEPDEPTQPALSGTISPNPAAQAARKPVVLTPTNNAGDSAASQDVESGK